MLGIRYLVPGARQPVVIHGGVHSVCYWDGRARGYSG